MLAYKQPEFIYTLSWGHPEQPLQMALWHISYPCDSEQRKGDSTQSMYFNCFHVPICNNKQRRWWQQLFGLWFKAV